MSETLEADVSPPTDAPEPAVTDAPNSQEMEAPAPVEQAETELPAPSEQVETELPAPTEQVETELPAPTEQVETELPAPTEQAETELPAPTEQAETELPAPTEQTETELPAPTEQTETELPAPTEQAETELPAPTEQVDSTVEATSEEALKPIENEPPEVAPSDEALKLENPEDGTTSAVNPTDENSVPMTEAVNATDETISPTTEVPPVVEPSPALVDGEQVEDTIALIETVDPTEPVNAEPPPPDKLGKNRGELAVIYIDGGTNGTRLVLAKSNAGNAVSLHELGDALAALKLLRGSDQSEEAEAVFLSALRTTLASAAESMGRVSQVVLGLTAWYRESAAEDRDAFTSLWDEVGKCATESFPGCDFQVLNVTGAEEGRFEYKAATYAAKRTLGIDLDCVLSLGGGSIQCTCGPRRGGESCSFILRLQDGEDAIVADSNSTGAWEETCIAACEEGLSPCIAGWTSPSPEHEEPIEDQDPHMLMSGGSWYAALGAGLAGEDGPEATTHSLEIALQRLKDAAAKADGESKVRANAVRLYASLESLLRSANANLRSRCKIVFAREWKVDDATIRVTWSVGHFLELLEARREEEEEEEQEEPRAAADVLDTKGTGDLTSRDFMDKEEDPEAKLATETSVAEPTSEMQLPDPPELAPSSLNDDPEQQRQEDMDNPFTLPAKANVDSQSQDSVQRLSLLSGPQEPLPQIPPHSSQTLPKKQVPKVGGQGPGLVVYVVAPAAAATGEAALSAEEYTSLSTAALRSGAAVILSAAASGAVAALDFEVNRRNTLLREVEAFADSRYKAPKADASDESSLHDLFKALAVDDTGVLDAESIALGLRGLGFQGDVVGAAAALTPEGSNRVARADFVNALKAAAEQPELVAVCPGSLTNEEGIDSNNVAWPLVREIKAETGLASRELLELKAREACQLAGATGHGVVLVLAGRGRSLLQPSDYEHHIRQELLVATEKLPPTWPLLWNPGPAEVGLLSEAAMQRPVWALPKPNSPEVVVSWLRYLLVVRPGMPASTASGGH